MWYTLMIGTPDLPPRIYITKVVLRNPYLPFIIWLIKDNLIIVIYLKLVYRNLCSMLMVWNYLVKFLI